MLLEELSKIAAQCGNCRLVISYNGNDKYALGVSDGVTTPLVVNGTLVELQTAVAEKLPGYLELATKEAAECEGGEHGDDEGEFLFSGLHELFLSLLVLRFPVLG